MLCRKVHKMLASHWSGSSVGKRQIHRNFFYSLRDGTFIFMLGHTLNNLIRLYLRFLRGPLQSGEGTAAGGWFWRDRGLTEAICLRRNSPVAPLQFTCKWPETTSSKWTGLCFFSLLAALLKCVKTNPTHTEQGWRERDLKYTHFILIATCAGSTLTLDKPNPSNPHPPTLTRSLRWLSGTADRTLARLWSMRPVTNGNRPLIGI